MPRKRGRYRCSVCIPSLRKYVNVSVPVTWASRIETEDERIIKTACKTGVSKIMGKLYSIKIETWSPMGVIGKLMKHHPDRRFIIGQAPTIEDEKFQVGFADYWNAFPRIHSRFINAR